MKQDRKVIKPITIGSSVFVFTKKDADRLTNIQREILMQIAEQFADQQQELYACYIDKLGTIVVKDYDNLPVLEKQDRKR